MEAPPVQRRALGPRPALPAPRRLPALQGVSLGVREGEILAVSGPRGSGKDHAAAVSVRAGPAAGRRGVVQQRADAHHGPARPRATAPRPLRLDRPPPPCSCRSSTLGERRPPLMLRGAGRRRAKTAALEWLERLDVGDKARRRPHELQQAERQRVCIARALAVTPAVLFADEPTAPAPRRPRPRPADPHHGGPLRTASPSSSPRTTRGPPPWRTARWRCWTDARYGPCTCPRSRDSGGHRGHGSHGRPRRHRRHRDHWNLRNGRPGGVLALRLTRAAHLAVQLRRLLVAVASAGTGFLLLCALGTR